MSKNKGREIAKYVLIVIALAAVYFMAGKLGLSMALFNKSASPVWPPTGVAIAAIILLGYRFFPAVFIGAFFVNMVVTPSIPVSLGISLGNTMEALVGAYCIIKFANGKEAFYKNGTTLRSLLFIFIASVVSASIGVGALSLGGFIAQKAWLVWLTWLMGDAAGGIILVPLILIFSGKIHYSPKKINYFELCIAWIVLLAVLSILFLRVPFEISNAYHFVFICMFPLIWIAYRSNLKVTVSALFVTSIIAVYGTLSGIGVFNEGYSINFSLILLQFYIAMISVTILLVTTTISQHRELEMNLLKKVKR